MIISLFLIFLYIQSILANDCVYFDKAVKYLGSNYQNQYSKVSNCYNLNGITCNNNQHITEIKIYNVNKYKDDVSNAITEFENLQYLTLLVNLKNVQSNGHIPQSIFNLKNLKTLIISNNLDYNTSILPDNFNNLINLEKLDLSYNGFRGSFPKSICNLKKLKYLKLQKNRFEGTIPYNCKDLEELLLLNLEGNMDLHGYVPLYPKLGSCNFHTTDLCYLPDAICISKSMDKCTKNNIKSTDLENGNPNPHSNEYENIDTESTKSTESTHSSKYTESAIRLILKSKGKITNVRVIKRNELNKNYIYNDSSMPNSNQYKISSTFNPSAPPESSLLIK
ncbi:L domain-like protein [Anaeromyces robustus]|uniref:L domain-like protein n=1 Tax=Anaeromyces robustus TaxID=1754192 RepID=A0A1Y1WWG2_9FUNG|nr:L domain-like protein [Anaeromyces robustus]|eukprot:ORX77897.1 L domain-like protein [Anaeromyces robustus]